MGDLIGNKNVYKIKKAQKRLHIYSPGTKTKSY